MTEKVMLPAKVAGAIEELRNEGLTDFGIITGMASNGQVAFNTINQWTYQNNCRNTDKLLSAIVNGYEVEWDEMHFADLTDTEIYLGLLALEGKNENENAFLVAAAKAFRKNADHVTELWGELKNKCDEDPKAVESCRQKNEDVKPQLKYVVFANEADEDAFFVVLENKFDLRNPETKKDFITEMERVKQRIQKRSAREREEKVHVDDIVEWALKTLSEGGEK